MNKRSLERGAIHGSIFAIIALVILVLFFAGFSVWAYMQYNDQKTDVDGKVTVAVAEAVRDQSEIDEEKFLEREKQPLRQFVGPDDYGRLTFDYPKTWSAYQATDLRKGGGVTYEAYLHPMSVPPIEPVDQKFALRIVIEQTIYEKTLAKYDKQIKKNELKSSAWVNDNGLTGTRLTGSFTKDIRGTGIIIKMRDRTLTVRTDADIFLPDFDAITKTLNFNQ